LTLRVSLDRLRATEISKEIRISGYQAAGHQGNRISGEMNNERRTSNIELRTKKRKAVKVSGEEGR
jgi:hypothetical protein